MAAAPLVVAALPTLPRALDAIFSPLHVSWMEAPTFYAGLLLLRLALVAALAFGIERWTRAYPSEQRWLTRVAVGLALFIVALAELRNVILAGTGFGLWGEPAPAFAELGRGAAALRWLLFGALALGAVERAAPRPSARAARLIGRAVVALAIFVLGSVIALLVAAAAGTDFSLVSGPVVAVAVAVVLSQGFRHAVDQVTWRLTGHAAMPKEGDLSIYRAAALEAIVQGRDPRRDPALEAMRDRIRVPTVEADALARSLEELHGPELAEGIVVFGRYRVDGLLGRGGHGRAFVARDLKLDRIVVLKELDAMDAASVEARTAAALDHPNVVRVHDVAHHGGRGLIIMEYVEGGSLADRLREGRPLKDPARVALGFVAGLAAIHASGVAHGDLKPANLLIDVRGEPRIVDFGLAGAHAEATVTLVDGGGVGTPGYMAPEVLRGGRPSPRADVYAAGLVLDAIFQGAAPPAFAQVIAKARSADPAARYEDAIAMRAALIAQRQ